MTTRKGALVATVANPGPATSSTAKKSAGPKAQKPKPKVSNMAKKKGSSKAKSKKKPRRSNPGNPAAHGMLTLPRGTMLVPVGSGGAAKRKKPRGGHHPRKKNPEPPPHHTMLKNGAAAVGFGTLAATVGMLGGFALSKANIKNKWANVAANVATGALVGGGVGMLDCAAGTVTAHNYMVAAGQWAMTPSQSSQGQQQQTRALSAASATGASPQMLSRAAAPAMHGTDDDMGEQPPAEAIAPPRPNPMRRRPARQLQGYRGVSGLGSPLDNLGDGDELGSPLDNLGGFAHLSGIMADDVGSVMADDVGSPLDNLGDGDDVGDGDELGDDVEGFEHLNGIIADDVGDDLDGEGDADHLDAVIADDIGDDELAAAMGDDVDGADDELGYLRG